MWALILALYTNLSLAISPPTDAIKKNEEWVCVRWTGSADPTQNRPSVCLAWEKKEVPWFRRK
jgi:hypothetical protein